ncbi:hypothetical protein KKA93_00755 [Patescibacteria group bacterium]|nr:hypothetical protein [Patescibacteria group bacterium]MBU1663223.1 hypothetical protein [Patescibacteria group bacterium]MBU1934374.1 hypothetical protein [Patescibacteria group bacterium]
MLFYRTILKQAWELTWRNKYLWWFGIFAALVGNGGEFEILFNNAGANPGQALFPAWQRIASTGVFSGHTIANIRNLLKQDILNMIFVLVVCLTILAICLFLIWLIIVSQAAIVNNSAAIIKQKKPTIRDGLDSGILNFWPVLTLNIIIKAMIYILLVAVSLPVIFFQGSFNANLFYIIALVIAVPVAIILSFIMKYAVAYVVINKSKVMSAIKQSCQLFKKNWLISFEMAIILFFINLLVGMVIVLAILVLAVPFLFFGLIFYYSFSLVGFWLIVILAVASFLFIVVSVGAALAVFQISSWTGLFLELQNNKGASKLVRLVNSIVKVG